MSKDDKNTPRSKSSSPKLSSGEERAYPAYRPAHLKKKGAAAPVRKKKKAVSSRRRRSSGGGGQGGAGRSSLWKWAWRCAFGFFAALVVGIGIMIIGLPDVSTLNEIKKTHGITIKSEDGVIIGSYGDIYGDYLQYEQLPDHLVKAVVATEDRNFFHHFGVDPFGLARATVANARAGKVVQGGSTITQQVVKNIFLTADKTLYRKAQEMLLAFWLEWKFTKKEILVLYLNRVYLGAGNFGVDAASRRYFGKSARDMTAAESAIIVGLLKAPTRYAPTSNPKLAAKRGEQVVLNMVDAGLIDQKKATQIIKSFPKKFSYREGNVSGSLYFSDWVVDQLPDILENVQEDIIITTTLNVANQRQAEDAVGKVLAEKSAEMHASQAALVAMTPDGAIKAMVGGRNYNDSQFNRAAQASRQPGSAFKLFVYLAAMEAGYSPDDVMEDRPVYIGKWNPKNYDGKYRGWISLRSALAESVNTVAVQLSEQVGRVRVSHMAERLGIKNAPANASIALGTGEVTLVELTGAYAHLPAEGRNVKPYAISKIETTGGEVLFARKEPEETRALSANVVAKMNAMLTAVVSYGTATGAAIGRPVAGKTGTNQDYKDAWFIGFTPQMVTGVWVGNDDSSPMKKVTGGSLPASIWANYMKQAMAKLPVKSIPTSYSNEGSILPWMQNTPTGAPVSTHVTPDTTPANDNKVNLSPSFWDKLGGGDGDIKYEYPSDKRRR